MFSSPFERMQLGKASRRSMSLRYIVANMLTDHT